MTTSNTNSKRLTPEDIQTIAKGFGLDPQSLEAFVDAYAPDDGFLPDGRPIVVFQRHLFWKNVVPFYNVGLKRRQFKAIAWANRDIMHPTPSPAAAVNHQDEWKKLERAINIHEQAAYQSVLWGRFGLPGEYYLSAGFSDLNAFANAHHKNESEQLRAFLNHLSSIDSGGQKLLDHLKNKDLEKFTAGFRGDINLKKIDSEALNAAFEAIEKASDTPEPLPFEARLQRTSSTATQTLGELTIYKLGDAIFSCKTLELPWKNNARKESCIPTGSYSVVKRHSPRYKDHFHLSDVPGRSFILIHVGNYYTQTEGCILVGAAHSDIDADGHLDVIQSGPTMRKLNELLPDAFPITVENAV